MVNYMLVCSIDDGGTWFACLNCLSTNILCQVFVHACAKHQTFCLVCILQSEYSNYALTLSFVVFMTACIPCQGVFLH